MKYEFTTGTPITEQEALKQVAALGLHGLAFDDVHEEDETLHWHEFAAVTWVISGTGSFADEHGNVTHTGPGCRVQAAGRMAAPHPRRHTDPTGDRHEPSW